VQEFRPKMAENALRRVVAGGSWEEFPSGCGSKILFQQPVKRQATWGMSDEDSSDYPVAQQSSVA
jgi:hypothetical protein